MSEPIRMIKVPDNKGPLHYGPDGKIILIWPLRWVSVEELKRDYLR